MSYPNCVVHVIHNQDLKEIYTLYHVECSSSKNNRICLDRKLIEQPSLYHKDQKNQIARRGTF